MFQNNCIVLAAGSLSATDHLRDGNCKKKWAPGLMALSRLVLNYKEGAYLIPKILHYRDTAIPKEDQMGWTWP